MKVYVPEDDQQIQTGLILKLEEMQIREIMFTIVQFENHPISFANAEYQDICKHPASKISLKLCEECVMKLIYMYI
jgi:hypothetical protein